MTSAFVSYSRRDDEIASRLHSDLEANGITIWRDRQDITGGQFWDNRIEQALSDATIPNVLVLVSPDSMQSEMVRNEIEFAIQWRKNIIPVVVRDIQYRSLRLIRRNEIDLRNRYDDGLQELLYCLNQPVDLEAEVETEVSPLLTDLFHLSPQQRAAAQDNHRLTRLIAAPGTGKSLVIEERVRWLLSQGVEPKQIAVVSFTRAASRDLEQRIDRYCDRAGQAGGDEVKVTTLHSLALRVLRKAAMLHYPASPKVLDQWETEHIFDAEFSETKRDRSVPALAGLTPGRAADVRGAVEAFWNTGQWNHPSYIPPDEPVTEAEIGAFTEFHPSTTHTYSCVLPGEIIKKCVDGIHSGTLTPAALLELTHLIVDEYQDLNFTDQQFIKSFINYGCHVFIAGDDDQSIYSFRYAYPTGIQNFAEEFENVSNHTLTECFRCTPDVLAAGWTLISANQSPGRIPKTVSSFCENVQPRVNGTVHRWCFRSENAEYEAIAHSCKALIRKGIKPRDILILISNRNALLPGRSPMLEEKFQDVGLAVELPTGKHYTDSDDGRFVYALVRIACDLNLEDYVAHRTVLGLLKRVGPKAINGIRDKVIEHNLNYMDTFYNPLPENIFSTAEKTALRKARDICHAMQEWNEDDTITDRLDAIAALVEEHFDLEAVEEWRALVEPLPDLMSLGELRDFMSTDNSEQQETILQEVYQRLEIPVPEDGVLPQQVRIMTMHGAKGLNADVVIIPGLEDDILPGAKRSRYTGLIQESARQLYVSITRARHMAICSYATSRTRFGSREFDRGSSRFCQHLNGMFQVQENGLSEDAAQIIVEQKTAYGERLADRQRMLGPDT